MKYFLYILCASGLFVFGLMANSNSKGSKQPFKGIDLTGDYHRVKVEVVFDNGQKFNDADFKSKGELFIGSDSNFVFTFIKPDTPIEKMPGKLKKMVLLNPPEKRGFLTAKYAKFEFDIDIGFSFQGDSLVLNTRLNANQSPHKVGFSSTDYYVRK